MTDDEEDVWTDSRGPVCPWCATLLSTEHEDGRYDCPACGQPFLVETHVMHLYVTQKAREVTSDQAP